MLSSPFRYEFPYLAQLAFGELILFDQAADQQRWRAVEDALQQVAEHAAPRGLPADRGPVDVGPLGHVVLQVALGLKLAHHGQDGAVGGLAPPRDRLLHVVHRRRAPFPHDVHDLQLQAPQADLRRLLRHAKLPSNRSSYKSNITRVVDNVNKKIRRRQEKSAPCGNRCGPDLALYL